MIRAGAEGPGSEEGELPEDVVAAKSALRMTSSWSPSWYPLFAIIAESKMAWKSCHSPVDAKRVTCTSFDVRPDPHDPERMLVDAEPEEQPLSAAVKTESISSFAIPPGVG